MKFKYHLQTAEYNKLIYLIFSPYILSGKMLKDQHSLLPFEFYAKYAIDDNYLHLLKSPSCGEDVWVKSQLKEYFKTWCFSSSVTETNRRKHRK